MAFWLIIFLLLVLAGALLVVPVLRRGHSSPMTRDSLNKALYHHRLAELAHDEQHGVVEGKPQLIEELQETLLADIPGQARASAARPIGRWTLMPGLLVLVLLPMALYLKSGGLVQVAEWHQAVADLPALRARVADEHAAPLTAGEVARLGLGVRSELQQQPDNVSDWLLLGRVGVALDNADTATQAFARAYALQPENREAQLSYAEVLTRSADAEQQKQAEQILRKLGEANPADLRVLNLLALNAFQQGQYGKALEGWTLMLRVLPPDDPRVDMLKRSISQARAKAGLDNARLAVAVTLSAEAARQLPAQGMVILSVTDGHSPVPVAVKRLPLSRFPLQLTIDDTNAMMPERLLSSIHQAKVRVRISPEGQAAPRTGEWFGDSALLSLDGQPQVNIEINQQVP